MTLWMPGYQSRGALDAAGAAEDAATTAWVNAVVADGGAVSTTQRTRVNTLITTLKGNGVWTSLKRMWLYAGESDSHQAKIDIRNLATHTVVGGNTLAAGGYTSNGTTGWINSGYNPNTDSLSPDTAAMGFYSRTNDTSGNSFNFFGAVGAGGGFYTLLAGAASFGNWTLDMADNSFSTGANAAGTDIGQYVLWASDSTHMGLDRNESSILTKAKSGSTFESAVIAVQAFNTNGTFSGPTICQGASFWITADSTQRTTIANALNAYMTAWGINVY